MNDRIDFRPLEKLADEWDEVKANELFRGYLKKLEAYLDIAPVDKQVSISMASRKDSKGITAQNVFEAWVERNYAENGLELTIFEGSGKLLPYVLLRELYYCFLAKQVRSFESVQHAVNVVLVEDATFGKHRLREDRTSEWRKFIDETRRQKEQELERLEGYFIDDTLHQQVLRDLFWYLRKHENLIKPTSENLSNVLFQVYLSNTSELLFEKNGQIDLVETLRCLDVIFKSVKQYRALLEYEKYFQEFKKNGTLKTDLSLNKFKNSMRQIKHTVISPAYRANWGLLGIDVVLLVVKFNPALKPFLVEKIVQNWGFAYSVRKFHFSSSFEMLTGFLLPREYYRDLNGYFYQLKELGYVLSFSIGKYLSYATTLNLNRYIDFNDRNGLINPNNSRFNSKHEIYSGDLQMDAEKTISPSIVDFLIIDRIRMFSITGLGFERRAEQLQVLNNDLKKEISNQLGLLKRFEQNFFEIVKSENIKKRFAEFIEKHRSDGFFYVRDFLSTSLIGLKFVKNLESLYPDFKSVSQLQNLLRANKLSSRFEENLIFTNKSLKKIISGKFIPSYFQSKTKFKETLDEYQTFYDVLDSCSELKLFDLGKILNLINDFSLTEKVLAVKKERIEKYYLKYDNYSFTEKKFDELLEDLLNEDSPVIAPKLFSTVPKEASTIYIGVFTSKNSDKFKAKLRSLEPYFESNEKITLYDPELNYSFFLIFFYVPFMTLSERLLFTSIVSDLFSDELLFFKVCRGYPWTPIVSIRDHYNFDEDRFFYTKDYFKHQLLYAKKILGDLPYYRKNKEANLSPKTSQAFYLKDSSLESLAKVMRRRFKNAKSSVDKNLLERAIKLYLNLKQTLLQRDDFNALRNEEFYKTYVKAVKFLPVFSYFGLSQYYLYVYPTDLSRVDFASLLTNSFQSVKYNLGFDASRPLLIKYLFPFRNPNMAYVNRIAKTEKIIREYCAFAVKKAYQVLHADNSLPSDNWSVDPKKFEIYAQNVLFNPDYSVEPSPIKKFDMWKIPTTRALGPETYEFKHLSEIYSRKSIDLYSPVFSNKRLTERVRELLEKGLLFPYLKLKNLGLYEKLYVIVPKVNSEANEKLLTLFRYFNYSFIYEIEGETFINGLDDVIRFNEGLFVKLYLPNCNVGQIEQLFRQIFQVLEIEHYVILENMVKNDEFLKSVYGDLGFLKDYNPLLNLKWSSKDQKWLNHKLYDQEFKPVYPDLSYGKNNLRQGKRE